MKTDSIRLLQREAGKYARLSLAEEAALALALRSGDQNALNRLVLGNLRLVLYLARQYTGRGVDFDDLVSEGIIGLTKAARRYDPAQGARFGTFASVIVRQHMLGAVRNQVGAFRIPSQIARLRRAVTCTETALRDSLGRVPSDAEIARALDVSERRVRVVRGLQTAALSMDAAVDGGVTPLAELIADANDRDGANKAELSDHLASLQRHLERLAPRERTIVEHRFGLGGRERHTFQAIARKLGLTKERVRQLAELSIVQLRRAMAA